MKRIRRPLALLLLLWSLLLAGCTEPAAQPAVDLGQVEITQFRTEQPYVEINGNQPEFDPENLTTEAFESYSRLDYLGRCGVAYANICQEIMPTEPRGEIGQVKPSGWVTAKYDWVDGQYLYNRCHLIGFQLSGENANEKNLITGTRFMNTQGMLPFENEVADYVKGTGNHVLYRVTPVYDGADLVAWGVQMEAYSVEDDGAGICFNVLCFNAEPGVAIDYATGESWADPTIGTDETSYTSSSQEGDTLTTYVLNTSSKKFHLPDCDGAARISAQNRKETTTDRDTLVSQGYQPCGSCKP
ncbi:MAG: DNA/RNA non-specific endonuclease [Clostridiales bacterium]|nr:DNA/RNA non-specific endonuclease [Clostridiales bacterium]MDY4171405.1 DNA/RNA non-specific endonuclease [Evtepia sp.]